MTQPDSTLQILAICPGCEMPWYGKVEYCPYCGKDVAAVSVKPKAIDAAIDMVEVSATPTVMAVEVEEASRNPRHLPSETGVAKSRKNIQIATAKQEPKQTESVSNAVHQEVSVPSSPAQPIGTLPDGAVSLTQDKSIPKIAVASILIILIVIFFASKIHLNQERVDTLSGDRSHGLAEFNQLVSLTPSGSIKESLAPYQINEAAKHIGAMLAGAKRSDEALILSASHLLQTIAAPQRGNRKEARTSNAAGLKALRKGDLGLAVKTFLNAAKADPADQEVLNNLAHALYKTQRFEDSLPILLATLSLAPKRTSAWVDLAMVLSVTGKSDTAVSAFLLAYRFSQDQLKTKDFLQQLIQKDPSEKVKADAQRALKQIN